MDKRENLQSEKDLDFNSGQTENIDYEAWTEMLSYYRYYVDKFCVDCLGMTNLYPFQRLLLRAMATHNQNLIVATRGECLAPTIWQHVVKDRAKSVKAKFVKKEFYE